MLLKKREIKTAKKKNIKNLPKEGKSIIFFFLKIRINIAKNQTITAGLKKKRVYFLLNGEKNRIIPIQKSRNLGIRFPHLTLILIQRLTTTYHP